MLPSMVGCAKPRWTHPQGRLAALRPVSPASAGLFFRWCPQEGAVLERGSPGYLRGPMSHQNRHDFRRSEEGVGWHQGRPCTRPPVWPGAWPSLRWSQLQWRAWPSHLDTPDTSDRNDWIHQRSKSPVSVSRLGMQARSEDRHRSTIGVAQGRKKRADSDDQSQPLRWNRQ